MLLVPPIMSSMQSCSPKSVPNHINTTIHKNTKSARYGGLHARRRALGLLLALDMVRRSPLQEESFFPILSCLQRLQIEIYLMLGLLILYVSYKPYTRVNVMRHQSRVYWGSSHVRWAGNSAVDADATAALLVSVSVLITRHSYGLLRLNSGSGAGTRKLRK